MTYEHVPVPALPCNLFCLCLFHVRIQMPRVLVLCICPMHVVYLLFIVFILIFCEVLLFWHEAGNHNYRQIPHLTKIGRGRIQQQQQQQQQQQRPAAAAGSSAAPEPLNSGKCNITNTNPNLNATLKFAVNLRSLLATNAHTYAYMYLPGATATSQFYFLVCKSSTLPL